jgi:Zn-finger nucleic acid-binding protein
MKCPSCRVILVSAERQGVEIDYCPCCWGIWLDKGELNLILDRAIGIPPGAAATNLGATSTAATPPLVAAS